MIQVLADRCCSLSVMRGGSREMPANLVNIFEPRDAIRDLGELAQQFATDVARYQLKGRRGDRGLEAFSVGLF